MPWTETRSRDEWLAEVKRRGGRIRRRRRLAVALVGVLALVLPVTALGAFLGGRTDRDIALTPAGPAPAVDVPPPSVVPTLVAGDGPLSAPVQSAPAAARSDGPALPATPSPTTTAEVQARAAGAGGPSPSTSSTSVPPADDPVVRRGPTSPSTNGSSASSAPAVTSSTVPSSDDPPLAACPASEVRVTVTTEKATFATGETVKGSSTIENRSATACFLPTRGFFHIQDAAGKMVGSFAYTADFRPPVKAEPGKTFSSGFVWDQKDCSGFACVQAPAGSYVAVADWTEGGPYSGRGPFQIGA